MTTILDVKKAFEVFFNDNYNTTPVHWAGMPFDTSAHDEWVYYEYYGNTVSDSGLDNTKNVHEGDLNITVVAKTPFRVHDIASVALALFKGKKIGEMFIKGVNIIDQGFDKELDRSFMVLNIKAYNY